MRQKNNQYFDNMFFQRILIIKNGKQYGTIDGKNPIETIEAMFKSLKAVF